MNPTKTYNNQRVQPVYDDAKTFGIRIAPNLRVPRGTLLREVTATNASKVQTITISGSPTGGTFTLRWLNSEPTAALAHNATAAQVQAALQALSTVGAGNMTVTGSAGGPFTVTNAGALANADLPNIEVAANNLTGGSSPSVAVAQTTAGVSNGAYIIWDNTGVPVIAEMDSASDQFGRIVAGLVTTPEFGYLGHIQAYFAGTFRLADLSGYNSNAATAWGSRIIRAGVVRIP